MVLKTRLKTDIEYYHKKYWAKISSYDFKVTCEIINIYVK